VPSEPCTDASDRQPDDAEAGAVGGALTYGTILDQIPFGLVVADSPSGLFDDEAERILGHPLIPVDRREEYVRTAPSMPTAPSWPAVRRSRRRWSEPTA
jgi:hypothetical protein